MNSALLAGVSIAKQAECRRAGTPKSTRSFRQCRKFRALWAKEGNFLGVQ